MSISDVLSEAMDKIMRQYLYDGRGRPRNLYEAEWIQSELLPVLTAMNTAVRRMDTPPSIPVSEVKPLHCAYCDMDFPDAIAIQHHTLFNRHVVGDIAAELRGENPDDETRDLF